MKYVQKYYTRNAKIYLKTQKQKTKLLEMKYF